MKAIATDHTYRWGGGEGTITIRLIAKTPAEARRLKKVCEKLGYHVRSEKYRHMKVVPGEPRWKNGLRSMSIDFDYY